MRKLGFLFVLGVVLFTLASSTCSKNTEKINEGITPPVGVNHQPDTTHGKGSGAGSSSSIKYASLTVTVRQGTSIGPFIGGADVWLYDNRDSLALGNYISGTSRQETDTNRFSPTIGQTTFTKVPVRSNIIAHTSYLDGSMVQHSGDTSTTGSGITLTPGSTHNNVVIIAN